MKLALAIVCSVLLAGVPFSPAQTVPVTCAKQAIHSCCRHGCTMPCCQGRNSSQPSPAAPTSTAKPGQFSFILVPAITGSVLPGSLHFSLAQFAPIMRVEAGHPLYARNCARLL